VLRHLANHTNKVVHNLLDQKDKKNCWTPLPLPLLDRKRRRLLQSPTGLLMATVKSYDGNIPIIEALRHEHLNCARILLERDQIGDVDQDGWGVVHYAVKLGDGEFLEAVMLHSSFVKGMKTLDGKTVELVAMESGVWCGRIPELVRRYNSMGWQE